MCTGDASAVRRTSQDWTILESFLAVSLKRYQSNNRWDRILGAKSPLGMIKYRVPNHNSSVPTDPGLASWSATARRPVVSLQ